MDIQELRCKRDRLEKKMTRVISVMVRMFYRHVDYNIVAIRIPLKPDQNNRYQVQHVQIRLEEI